MLHLRETDINARKNREDECLDEGNEELEAIKEDAQQNADSRHDIIARTWQRHSGDEDDAQHADEGAVTSHDVGKESDCEREGLGEESDELNHSHDGTQPGRQLLVPEDLRPIRSRTVDVGDHEGEECQRHGDCDVAGQVGRARDESAQVGEEDEEEGCEQIGRIAIDILRNVGFDDVIVDEAHQHLNRSDQSALGSLGLGILALVPIGTMNQHPDEKNADDEETGYILGD